MERLNLIKGHVDQSLTAEKKKKKEKSTALMPFWVMKNSKLPEMTPREGYSLKGKVAVITGGNRGIGYACARNLAEMGCNIVIGAKTLVPKEKTQETIFMARNDLIKDFGVKVAATKCDVRSDQDCEDLINFTIKEFGRIDILVNNAAALVPQKTEVLTMKQYDLMHQISVRGAFYLCKLALPYLTKSDNPHVLFMVPPINLEREIFLTSHLGYTTSKFGVAMMMKGLAAEFKGECAFNSLWPRTGIHTNAIKNVTNSDGISQLLRLPDIMGKAARTIFQSDFETFTGHSFIDDEVLIGAGQETMASLQNYNCDVDTPDYVLMPDLLL